MKFREWFKPALVPVLVATTATTLATAGYETAIVGGLRDSGQVEWAASSSRSAGSAPSSARSCTAR